MQSETGKWLIAAGILLFIVGIFVYFFHDKLSWLARLPGDIRIERENFKFYFPITTTILLSIVLTILINLVKKFF